MSKFGISFGPLTGQIFIGRLNKARTIFLDGKEDHTNQAVACVAEYVLGEHDGAMTLTAEDGSGWEVNVTKLPPASGVVL